jgi:cobalamin biosynthesis protein CobT
MSQPLQPLWLAMLQASDQALEGREFDDIREIERVMMQAQILAVKGWLEQELPGLSAIVGTVLAREAQRARAGDKV